MKISVISVTYNAAACLDAALQSLRRQTFPDIEFIVVDGGSTDDTLNLVRRYPELCPIVHSEADDGIYDAMNKGVRLATGDAIYFLNADDSLAQPESLSWLAEALESNPDAGVVYGDILIRSPERDTWRSHEHWKPARLGWDPLCHQAALCRRSLFDRVGQFHTEYRVSADLEWFMRCDALGVGFSHVPRLVCVYSAGGESDRLTDLRRKENRRILATYRSGSSRVRQRVAAAVRRRLALLTVR